MKEPVGLACFFIIESIEKTLDSKSGLSFKRFFSDLKKQWVIPLILFAILYRKTGNCLISFIPHFLSNMIGFFLVPIMFG